MKLISTLLLIICLALTSNLLYAQSKKGQIEGYVKDVQTGDVLPFTSVSIAGTTIGALTNDKGFYQIVSVTPGPVRLKVSFIGYQDTTVSVEVLENKTIKQDINLTFGTAIEGVTITAQAYGQVRAINTQLGSTNIKNVISEVKIRELPDANLAEALTRLPGVSVVRSGGEATDIKIRGVGSNTLYVNGMPVGGGLGSIAPSMIGSIELSKAFLPDQDAGVMGGSVEVKMRVADKGFKKDIWFSSGYNDFTKSFKMQNLSALLSNRFFKDKLGVMLSLNWDRKNHGNDVLSASYAAVGSSGTGSDDVKQLEINNVSLTHTQNLNNRYGVTVYTDYKLKGGKLFYQGFFSDLESQNKWTSNNYADQLTYNSTESVKTDRNLMNGIGGEHEIMGAKLDWGVYSTRFFYDVPDELSYNAWNPEGMGDLNVVDSSTTIEQFMALGTHDLSKTYADGIYRTNYKGTTNQMEYNMNVKVPISITDNILGYIKFGGKLKTIGREYFLDQPIGGNLKKDAYEVALIRDTLPDRTPNIDWVLYENNQYGHVNFAGDNSPQDFSMMNAKLYYAPDFGTVRYVADQMEGIFGKYYAVQRNNYTNNEQDYAGYIMAGLNLGKMVTFTPGVRYEYNTYETTAKKYFAKEASPIAPASAQGTMTDTTGNSYDKNWFPMVHLKIKPLKWFDIRLSYTQTITRPEFDSRSPRYNRDISYNVSQGNVNLRPQLNTNYDLYLSFYTGKVGLFTVGAFYKKIVDQVFNYQVRMIDASVYGYPAPYNNKYFTQMINNPKPGYIQGIEVDWQTQFSYLPGILKGIILNANLTAMQSTTKYPFYSFTKYLVYDEFGKPKAPYGKSPGKNDFRTNKIIGMPDFVGNVALGYERGGFSGRVSVYYQSYTISGAPDPIEKSIDQTKDQLLRLDLQLSQKFKKVKGLMVYFNMNNITNNPDRNVMTFYHEKISREERYGASGDIGIRYRF